MKKILILLMFIGLSLGLVACTVELGQINFDEPTIELEEGDSHTLAANLINFAEDAEISWSTNDVSIISISEKEDGSWEVLALSAGNATAVISAKDMGNRERTATLNIVVKEEEVSDLVINVTGSETAKIGDKVQLTAVLSRTSEEAVTWSVSDTTKATVSAEGLVDILKDGEVVVTAKCENVTKNFIIVVDVAVNSVVITGEDSVLVNKYINLVAEIDPADAGLSVTWASDDVTVAKVTKTGMVVGIKSGVANITATVAGVVATHQVTVVATTSFLTPEDLTAIGDFEITFRVPFGDAIKQVIRDMIASFQTEWKETYGTNITVTLEEVGGYTELNTGLVYDLQSGTAPTVSVGYPDHFAGYLVGNALEPLNQYINDPIYGFLNGEMKDIYDDYLVECRQFDQAGTYYALPFNKSTELFIYNYTFFLEFLEDFKTVIPGATCVEDLFKDLTWQNIEAISKKTLEIVKSGRADDCLQIKGKEITTFVPFSWDSTANLFITAIRQWGGTYTKPIYLSSGKVNLMAGEISFNSDETRSALSYLKEQSFYATESTRTPLFAVPEYWEKSYASDPFKAGECVMTVGSSAGVSYNTGGVGQIGVAAIPYNSLKNIKQVIQQGTNITIFSAAEEHEKLAAWLLIKHFLSTDNAAHFAASTGYFPISKSARETEEYQTFIKKGYNPYNKNEDGSYVLNEEKPVINKNYSAVAAAATVDYNALGFTYFVDPAWSGSATVRTKVETIITQVVVAGKDIQTSIDDVLSTIQ